jgi:two-component system LytT family response regulator
LKPIDVEELKKAVRKAHKMRLLRGLTDQETSSATISFKIPVHDGDQVVYIPDNEIISLHAEGRYTRIIRQNGQQSMVARNLKTFEEMSCTKGSFCRISRSVILNMSFVQSYTKSEPFTVILKNGDVHEVSRRKRAAILSGLKAEK